MKNIRYYLQPNSTGLELSHHEYEYVLTPPLSSDTDKMRHKVNFWDDLID